MASWTEVRTDGPTSSQETLSLSRGLEAPHRPFTLPRGLMRVFRAVVEALVFPVLHTRHDFFLCGFVAAELVGDQYARHVLAPLEQLAEELLGCSFVPPALDEDIEHIAFLVDRPPEIVGLAIDLEEHFIQVPLVTRARTSSAQLVGVGLAEFGKRE